MNLQASSNFNRKVRGTDDNVLYFCVKFWCSFDHASIILVTDQFNAQILVL